MKLRKILSLSAVLSATLVMSGVDVFKETTDDSFSDDKMVEPVKTVVYQDLKFKTDTLHLTDDNFDVVYPHAVAGLFFPKKNEISITYFECDDNSSERIKNVCDRGNSGVRVVMRHEMEHARKAHIVYNTPGLSRWDRARVAAMDEVMAPAAEIIESQEYRLETGERFPQDRQFLWKADSLIMARHNQTHFGFGKNVPVNFSDPVIADIVLESAVNKFAQVHNRGFYKKRIQRELAGTMRINYIPNSQTDIDFSFFLPHYNQWGAMWTYNVSTPWYMKHRVDIWNSATAAARMRVINKIDSIVSSDMTPGQKLSLNVYKKSR